MKKIFILILVLFIAASAIGCAVKDNTNDEGNNAQNQLSSITGYIMDIGDGRILVVGNEAADYSATGGVEEFYNAIWFSKAPDNVKLGDMVKVWYDIVLESYPAQSDVEKLEVIQLEKPAGADLTQTQALNKALTEKIFKTEALIAVKSIEYKSDTDKWSIEIKEIAGDSTSTYEIEDK